MYNVADSSVCRLCFGIENRMCLLWNAFVVFGCNKTAIGDDLFIPLADS